MTRAFIFDLDGTLADTMPAHYVAWSQVMERYGLTFSEERFYRLGGMPATKIVQLLADEAGLVVDVRRIAEEKERTFVESLLAGAAIEPIAPVVAIAAQRRSEGLLAVASGGLRAVVERTLQILGIIEWFPVIVAAEDTPRHKPEPDVFLEAARRMGVLPADCTVYEDADLGLEAARRAGMSFVDVRPLYARRLLSIA